MNLSDINCLRLKTCNAKEGCDGELYARGLCNKHYQRGLYAGKRMPAKTCKRVGCGRKHRAAGLCMPCYQEKYNRDNPNRRKLGCTLPMEHEK